MKKRSQQLEQLDELSLDGPKLSNALKSLAWVNRWFGNHTLINQAVLQIIHQHPQQKHFGIIDLGCGGGDVLRKLAGQLQKKNISFSMTGIDGNAHALQYAKSNGNLFPQIKYQQADLLDPNFQLPLCDILISSHFIYHFRSKGLQQFFEKNLAHVNLAFINSGLERRKGALRLFKYFSYLLPLSKLAKADGQLAIQRAFTKKELSQIIDPLPYQNMALKRLPFFRLKLIIPTASKKQPV